MPQCICKTQAIAIAARLWRWDFAQRKANNKRWLPKNGPRIVKATLKSNYSDYCGLLLSGQFYLNSVKRWSLPSRLFVRDSIYLQEMLRWNKQVSIVEYSTTEGQSDASTALNYLARSEHVQPRAPGGRGIPIWNRRGNSSCPKFETLNDCRYHYIYVNRIDIERKRDLRCGGSAVLVARAGENGGRSHTLCKDETTELLPYKLQE